MASKVPQRKSKSSGQYRKQGKTVGVYERPRKKKTKNPWALPLAIIIILAMVLSLLLVGRF
jgi:hypothetical protein